MEEIANQVFIEHCFSGVVTAALKLRRGLVIIDSPCSVDERKSWQQKLINLGSGVSQMVILLDTHADRLLSMPPLDAPILVHENALEVFNSLPIAFRPLEKSPGTDLESQDISQSTRWSLPDFCYSKQVSLHWDDQPIVITHQPGAHIAGSWVKYDAEKVLFVGDSVVVNQPPFLAWCSIERWIEELNWLRSDFFKHHKIVSGRDGVIFQSDIVNMINFLSHLKGVVNATFDGIVDEGIETELPGLLKYFNFDKDLTALYEKRLFDEINRLIKRIKNNAEQGVVNADS
jgi:glyoxylase-like metal-dependent hydrolase (beta-lactamase superfamily II)